LEAALRLVYYSGGVRLDERLGLKTIDLNGSDKMLIVQRRPDDRNDPRLEPMLTKTLPHPVPVDDRLAHALHGFIVNHS
jgi:integrase